MTTSKNLKCFQLSVPYTSDVQPAGHGRDVWGWDYLKPNVKSKARPVEQNLYSRYISEKLYVYWQSWFIKIQSSSTGPPPEASLWWRMICLTDCTHSAGWPSGLSLQQGQKYKSYLATDIAEVTHYQKEGFWRKLTGVLQLPAIWGLKWILELFRLSAERRF